MNETKTCPSWVEIGALDAFSEGKPVLRKQAGRRFACVRVDGAVHAIDDLCPHQGYPLSQGEVTGGVLTCEWHNWKFDLATGDCTFGGEPVKRYPTRIEGGRVYLDVAIDIDAESARLTSGVNAALTDDDAARALREALRLGALTDPHPGLGQLAQGFALVAADGARRAEYGFDHGLALLADLMSWTERGAVDAESAFALGAHAVAEPSRRLAPRSVPKDLEAPLDPARLVDALVGERRAEAEARARRIAEENGIAAAVCALLPFVARHIYDYGHGAIFLAKARELALRFPESRGVILGASALELAFATADSSLPPFAATRAALGRVDAISALGNGGFDRRAFEANVLDGERVAVAATMTLLETQVDPVGLLRAIAHAAAIRLSRFDAAWEKRVDAEVSVLDVTHTLTFAESAIALANLASPRELARLAVLSAGFVGKVRKGDREDGGPEAASGKSLEQSLSDRDVAAALGATRGHDAAGRAEIYRALSPFCAFDAAVRPIFYAHTVKNAEALRRLDAADPEADGAYLDALVAYVVPRRPENRARRTGAVAKKFLADGRPPEGLY